MQDDIFFILQIFIIAAGIVTVGAVLFALLLTLIDMALCHIEDWRERHGN